jgi:hypothetical protein
VAVDISVSVLFEAEKMAGNSKKGFLAPSHFVNVSFCKVTKWAEHRFDDFDQSNLVREHQLKGKAEYS